MAQNYNSLLESHTTDKTKEEGIYTWGYKAMQGNNNNNNKIGLELL